MIPLLAGLVAVAAMAMLLDPYLEGARPRRLYFALTGLVVGIPAGIILAGLGDDYSPLRLLPVALGMAILGGATATDVLRGRMANGYLIAGAVVAVLVLQAINDHLISGVLGLLAVGAAGAVVYGGGALYARVRGLTPEALTDEELGPVFGWGDVIAYLLVGAMLGGPTLGILAFVLSMFINGILAIGTWIFGRIRGRASSELYMPYLPGVAVGVMLALFFAASD